MLLTLQNRHTISTSKDTSDWNKNWNGNKRLGLKARAPAEGNNWSRQPAREGHQIGDIVLEDCWLVMLPIDGHLTNLSLVNAYLMKIPHLMFGLDSSSSYFNYTSKHTCTSKFIIRLAPHAFSICLVTLVSMTHFCCKIITTNDISYDCHIKAAELAWHGVHIIPHHMHTNFMDTSNFKKLDIHQPLASTGLV